MKNIDLNEQENIIVKSIKGGNAPNMVPDYCEAVIEGGEDLSIVEEKLNKFIKEKKLSIEHGKRR